MDIMLDAAGAMGSLPLARSDMPKLLAKQCDPEGLELNFCISS